MSQKSNARKSQRASLPHHEMKRGLNNWGKGNPSMQQITKNLQVLNERKESNDQPSLFPEIKSNLQTQNPIGLDRTENKPKKKDASLIL